MFTKLLLSVTFLTALFFAVTCDQAVSNDDPTDQDTTTTPSIAEGTWHYALPPIPTKTTDTLNIWLDVVNDSSYSLRLIERSDKKLFSSYGKWRETEDSVFLTGSECEILDTTANPDTLAPLDDSLCSIPIPLPQPETATKWTIKTRSLTVMLRAFPISPEDAELILVIFTEIPLAKVEE